MKTDEEEIIDLKNNRLDELMSIMEEVTGKAIIWANYQHDILKIEKETGLDLDPYYEEFSDKGELTDDSYKNLDKLGLPKDLVDSYMEITFPDYDNPVVIFYDGVRQLRLYEGIGERAFSIEDLLRILESINLRKLKQRHN